MTASISYAWLSPAAPAAIAVLQCQYQDAAALAAVFDRRLPAIGRARFALLQDPQGVAVDEVVLLHHEAGVLEIQCHGGVGIRAAIEACLRAHGMVAAEPVIDLAWDAFARVAHAAALAPLSAALDSGAEVLPELWFRRPVVLLTGPANAGKSTLLNAWCGHRRAIVSDRPGTTRDLLTAVTDHAGWHIQLLDSAGLRQGADDLERAGQALVEQARGWVDAVIYVSPSMDRERPGFRTGDILLASKCDVHANQDSAALPWSAPEFGNNDSSSQQLQALGDVLLQRLGLATDLAR